MNANNNNGPMATLLLPTSNLILIGFAKTVLDVMQGNAQFPSPTPTLAVFAADVAALEDAETEAAKRTKGAATLRDARSKKVKVDLKQLRAYVQSVADAELDPALAAAIIESAFMSVRKAAQRMKDELRVRNTSISGRSAVRVWALSA